MPTTNNKKKSSASVKKAPAKKKQNSKSKEPDDALYEVALRRQYYKDGAGFSMKMAACAAIALSLSVGLAYHSITKKTENKYLVTNPDATITKLIPLSRPNQSEAVVRNWLVEALANSLEFNYVDYRKRLNQSVGEYFTESGGSDFIASLDDIDLLDTVKDQRLLVSVDIATSPILIRNGRLQGSRFYSWEFQTKGLLTLRNESVIYNIPVSMQITISRRSLLENPKGLGISRVFIKKDNK